MMMMMMMSCSFCSFQLVGALNMLNSVLLIQAIVIVLLRESQVATAMSKFLQRLTCNQAQVPYT